MPNGASGSGSGTGEQAITPSIFPGQGGGESNILWAQSSSVSPRFSNAQTPQQQQQQSQSSQTPNGGRSAEDSSLPQTEHAQMFLRLLENKITHQGNVKDYEQLGFRPPMMAREGSDNPSSPSTGAGGNPALKRKASHDDMMRMPAPAARAKKIALSNSSENLSRESVDSLSAGSIYSRLSQHPAFLSTNVYELEELVDALGESQLQKAAGKASASAPHGKSPESASRSSSSSSNTSSSSKTSSSTTRSSSATSGTSAQSQQQQQQSSSGKATKSTSSASSHREEDAAEEAARRNSSGSIERAFGYLDRKFASGSSAPPVNAGSNQQKKSAQKMRQQRSSSGSSARDGLDKSPASAYQSSLTPVHLDRMS